MTKTTHGGRREGAGRKPHPETRHKVRHLKVPPDLDRAVAERDDSYSAALYAILRRYLHMMDAAQMYLRELFPAEAERAAILAATTSLNLDDTRLAETIGYSIIDNAVDQSLDVPADFAARIESLSLAERVALVDACAVWWRRESGDPSGLFAP